MIVVTLGDIVTPAEIERAGDQNFTVLSMTRSAGLVAQETVFNKVVTSRDLSSYKVVRPNQLVVGIHVNEGALGVSGPDQVGVVSPAYTLWDLKGPNLVDPAYLDRFIRCPQAIAYFISKYRQTAERRGKLTREHFLALQIPLPPPAEQKRIAAILDATDGLRAKRRESLVQLDTLLQSTFLDMFGDPVINPKGWEIQPLRKICELLNGYVFKSSDYVESSNTLSCRMSNIRPGGFFDLSHNPRYLPDDFGEQFARYLLKDGDVVIAMTDLADAPKILGVPTVVRTEGKRVLLNQRVGKLKIIDEANIHFEYFKAALNAPTTRTIYKKFAGGGLQINLGKNDLLSVTIPIPPIDLQRRFATIVESVEQQKVRLRVHLAELDTLFASLQQRAFNGEL